MDIHPLALLHTHLVMDLHWVKGGFVLDGSADCTRARLAASGITGGGPVEDLKDFGLGAGWRGTAGVRLTQLTADLSAAGATLASAIGDIAGFPDISSPEVASGTNLGGYDLRFNDPGGASSGADLNATLTDTGDGPIAVNATLQLSMKSAHRHFFGNRQGAPGHAAGAAQSAGQSCAAPCPGCEGRLPVDLEFTF